MTAKFERRFTGKDNAGLRKAIRAATANHRCGRANAEAVRGLARTIALTASGAFTLEQVARDYDGCSSFRASCDCEACYAGNCQRLGANEGTRS